MRKASNSFYLAVGWMSLPLHLLSTFLDSLLLPLEKFSFVEYLSLHSKEEKLSCHIFYLKLAGKMLAWHWITNGQCAKKVHDFFGLNFLVTELQQKSVGDCHHPWTLRNVIPLSCLFTQNLNWRNTLENWAPSGLVSSFLLNCCIFLYFLYWWGILFIA